MVISEIIPPKSLRRRSPELPKHQSALKYPTISETYNLRRHILCHHILQQCRQDLPAASNTSDDIDTYRRNNCSSNGDSGGGGCGNDEACTVQHVCADVDGAGRPPPCTPPGHHNLILRSARVFGCTGYVCMCTKNPENSGLTLRITKFLQ